ncbi:MAG: rhomboid family intramembrane serine protease [Bacteroidales bacterium]|nr:rhomboid family intramembrane serine protease [Bacteroidales bacterium]
MEKENSDNIEKKKLGISLIFPVAFLLAIWLVWFVEITLDLDFSRYGIFPRKLSGLKGIVFSPLIHADIKHLFNNSIPLLVLTAAIFYFYSSLAFRIFFLTWLMGGIWVWFGGREAYHIGASGLIYGFAAFLFVSGVIRNYIPLLAISMLVVFLYGSLIWGIFPIKPQISYESHMLGAIAGVVLAFHYRKFGPQRPKYNWEEEEELEDNEESTSPNES